MIFRIGSREWLFALYSTECLDVTTHYLMLPDNTMMSRRLRALMFSAWVSKIHDDDDALSRTIEYHFMTNALSRPIFVASSAHAELIWCKLFWWSNLQRRKTLRLHLLAITYEALHSKPLVISRLAMTYNRSNTSDGLSKPCHQCRRHSPSPRATTSASCSIRHTWGWAAPNLFFLAFLYFIFDMLDDYWLIAWLA